MSGKLHEQDLDAVSGGATQNRYDPKVCRSLTEARYECVGLFSSCWCDHYRREETARDNDYIYYEISCAMGCFMYNASRHHERMN